MIDMASWIPRRSVFNPQNMRLLLAMCFIFQGLWCEGAAEYCNINDFLMIIANIAYSPLFTFPTLLNGLLNVSFH